MIRRPTLIHLGACRYDVLASFFLRYAGLEPSIGELPDYYQAEFAEDTMPKSPRKHDSYWRDGGAHWPARWIISEGEAR